MYLSTAIGEVNPSTCVPCVCVRVCVGRECVCVCVCVGCEHSIIS